MKTTKELIFWGFAAFFLITWIIVADTWPTVSHTYFVPVFLVSLIILVTAGIVEISSTWKSFNVYTRIFLSLQFIFWPCFFILHYPGFFSYDGFESINQASIGSLSDWQSFVFSLFCQALFLITPSLSLLAALHIFIYLFLLFKIMQLAQMSRWHHVVVFSLLAISPMTQMTLLFISRDILFGLMTTYLIFELLRLQGQNLNLASLLKFSVLLFLTAEMRQDAKIYYLSFPAALVILKMLNVQKAIIYGLLMMALSVLANYLWVFKYQDSRHQIYQLTGIYHQLHNIVHSRPESLTETEKENINRVVPVTKMIESYEPYSISLFHQGLHSVPVDKNTWSTFCKTYLSLVFKNPDLFLRERVSVLVALFNFNSFGYLSSNDFDLDIPFFKEVKDRLKLKRIEVLNPLRLKYKNLLEISKSEILSWPKVLLYIVGPILFLLLCPLGLFVLALAIAVRTRPSRVFFVASFMIVFSRLPFVFLLAPEPHTTYMSPLIYVPFFFILAFTLNKTKTTTS